MTGVPSLLYSDLEDDLRLTVRAMLNDHSGWDRVLAHADGPEGSDADVWRRVSQDLGLVGLALPELHGGSGASWREVAVVCEELGATVAPVPFWTSAVAATALSEQLGASGLLAELASGRRVAAVAVPVTDHWSRARSGLRHVDGMLSGQVPMVAGALEADLLLVPLGDTVLLVQAADATIDDVQSLDMTRRLAGITFDEAPAQVVAQGVQVDAAVSRACDVAVSMLASEQLGLANRCLDLTLDYVKIRRQFGRSIGSYQAVKHRIADLWTDISQARATARYAAACAAEGSPDLAVASSVAHSVCSDVALRAAEECVQLHGGIGFTWEHPAHLLLKRARTDALTLGSPTWHRRRLADLAGLTSTTPNKETP